jgi:hypothetical protein
MLHLTQRNRFSLPVGAMLLAILIALSGAPAQAVSPTASRPVASQVTAWNALPNRGLGGDGSPSVRMMVVIGSDLYVGGGFERTGDDTLANLGCIVAGTSDGRQPEIQVLDGAADIPDGIGNVNFGITTVGTPIYKTFTVRNAGTADLTLIEPIDVPAGFGVANSFGSTALAPGSSTTFVVRLDAVAAGVYRGSLQFANNDGDENPFSFSLSGGVHHKLYLPLAIRP